MVIDTLITKYVLDPSGYQKGAKTVQQETARTASSMSGLHAGVNSIQGQLAMFSSAIKPLLAVAGALFAVAAAGTAAGVALMKQGAEFDALVKMLEAVEGGAEGAKKALADLRQIAKLPGLGFIESIEGYSKLRMSGLSPTFSQEVIRQFGNANATAGGGKAELNRILLAVSQMSNKPFLQGEELLQLLEAGIPATRMVKDAFGTADTEELKKRGVTSGQVLEVLVKELQKLPRVAGSAKNTFENLGDALVYASSLAGTALNTTLLGYVSEFVDAVENLADGGVIEKAFQGIADTIQSIFDSFSAGSMEQDLTQALAMVMTMAEGFRNLTLNAMGALEMFVELYEKTPQGKLLKALGLTGEGGPLGEFSLFESFQRNLSLLELQRQLAEKRGQKAADGQGGPADGTGSGSNAGADTLKQIERNTRPLLDLKQYALGGGELGKLGVSAIEERGLGGRTRSIKQAARQIEMVLHGLMSEQTRRMAKMAR